MRRVALGLGLAIATLVLGGCGSRVPPDTQATPAGRPVTGQPASGTTSQRTEGLDRPRLFASDGPSFPLTVSRTGGIADYHDTVVVRADGTVLVDTESLRGRVCHLSQPWQRQLLSALSTLPLSGPTAWPDDPTSDQTGALDPENAPIRLSVVDVNDRPIDLSAASLGAVSTMVDSLVVDVTLTTPAVTRCTTPASPTSTAPLPDD